MELVETLEQLAANPYNLANHFVQTDSSDIRLSLSKQINDDSVADSNKFADVSYPIPS